MHYRNNSLHLARTHPATLPLPSGDALAVTLQPLPLGFHRRLVGHGIAPPTPPVRIARDSSHKPLRDSNGHAVTLRDENDLEYRAALDLYHHRLAALMIAEALQADPHLRFDTPRPAEPSCDWTAYADAILSELQAAGWTDGLLLQLCETITRISGLIDDAINQAGRNFCTSPQPATS